MLLGLAATAVPIIIHLLSRQRHVDVTWAAMRFLITAESRNRRRLQLEDLLLLALRCAAIAAVVIAAAGPTLGRAVVGRGAVTAVLVIDQSASMSGNDGVASRFDHAKAAATSVIADLPTGSAVAVLMASDTVAPLIPAPTRDLSLARRAIADAPITDRSSDLLPTVRAACEVLAAVRGAKEIDVITDGQRSAWSHLDDVIAVLRAAPDVAVRVVP
jgi:Mg-chelatase subunit ChlD